LIKATFVRPGNEHTIVEATVGSTVMQAAVSNGVSEIVAECGGTLACATCHVYIDDATDRERLGNIGPDEEEMLGFTASPREPGSRLSCQLVLTPELDGLVVRVPPEQY
jgi:2Fe-2S ferredoxin